MKENLLKRCGAGLVRLALCFALLAALLPAAASAASSFRDVPAASYYGAAVAQMSELGVVHGYQDGTFRPQKSVSNAEALTMVCAMAGVQYKGYSGSSSPWYQDVVTWAQVNGVAAADVRPTAAATRAQLCEYLAAAYRLETDASANVFSDTASKAANKLYELGVVRGYAGTDGRPVLGGGQNVKRCDVCVMLSRLQEKAAQPDWSASTSFHLDKSRYTPAAPGTVRTFDELVDAIGYASLNGPGEFSFALQPESAVSDTAATLKNAGLYAQMKYIEPISNGAALGYSCPADSLARGKTALVTVYVDGYDFASGTWLSDEAMRQRSSAFLLACEKDVAQLYAAGSLASSMTAREKADVLCSYVDEHVRYDDTFRYYGGYDAAVTGTAVCEGYTAFYNCLCNLAGVPMTAVTDSHSLDHAWSRIQQDGVYYNVDATYCDQDDEWGRGYMHDRYFWVTDDAIRASDLESGPARVSDTAGVPYAFVG